jgi:hypothetical protein
MVQLVGLELAQCLDALALSDVLDRQRDESVMFKPATIERPDATAGLREIVCELEIAELLVLEHLAAPECPIAGCRARSSMLQRHARFMHVLVALADGGPRKSFGKSSCLHS